MVSRSTKTEYVAMSDAAKEAIFSRKQFIDKQGAEKLANNPIYHKRSKYIDIRSHHVLEVIKNKN